MKRLTTVDQDLEGMYLRRKENRNAAFSATPLRMEREVIYVCMYIYVCENENFNFSKVLIQLI